MKRESRILLGLFLGLLPVVASSQEKLEASIGCDLVSSYIWRGQKCGETSVQPTASLCYKGINLEAWGSVGITDSDDAKELDLTLSYNKGGFSIGITDYFVTSEDARYFLYDSGRTSHTFEAYASYDFNIFSIGWYTNFAGKDGMTKEGKRAYSSYFEANVPFNLGGLSFTATLGCVPYYTDYYADKNSSGFAVTNISLQAKKEISITSKFSLPLFAALTSNPSSQKMYLTAGITF